MSQKRTQDEVNFDDSPRDEVECESNMLYYLFSYSFNILISFSKTSLQ